MLCSFSLYRDSQQIDIPQQYDNHVKFLINPSWQGVTVVAIDTDIPLYTQWKQFGGGA